jgi:hypothetical protein
VSLGRLHAVRPGLWWLIEALVEVGLDRLADDSSPVFEQQRRNRVGACRPE